MTMFLYIVLLLLSAFLVMIVLLQRGRGGGLAGAFGAGGGAQTAFGTKTGDVFTWVTVIAFVLFMLLSIGLFMRIKWGSNPDQTPGRDAALLKNAPDDATGITPTSLTLVWKDQSSNAIGYHILQTDDVNRDPEYVVKDGVAVNVPANNPSGHYSYTITGLQPGTTYYYVVEAWNNTPQGARSPSPKQRASNGQLAVLTATTSGTKPAPVLAPSAASGATGSTATSQAAPAITAPASASAPAPEAMPATATAPATATSLPATTRSATTTTHP